jgi:uncharacterized membrane protein YccC
MGIAVYTLVSVFLWPRTNAGAIKKTSTALVATQAELFRVAADVMVGRDAKERPQELYTQEVQQLAAFRQALQAEGSESYEVHELQHLWRRLDGLSMALMETLDRWQRGFAELVTIDVNAVLPDLKAFCAELDGRFEEIQRVLGGSPPKRQPGEVSLAVDRTAAGRLSVVDRAALAVMKKELDNLEVLTAAMLDCARDLAGEPKRTKATEPRPFPGTTSRGLRLPVPDRGYLEGALFAAVTTAAGFLVWIFFDPPGHSGWYQLGGTVGMAIAGLPQVKVTGLIKPFAVALALGLATYVFIMPQLSSFLGLGLLLFLAMFIVRYFFSGLAVAAGQIAILNMIAVQNHQAYSFAAMANAYLFTLAALVFVYALSYMRRSPRPEKAVVHLLGRFFRNAEFLISRVELEQGHESSFLERWKTDFHRHELQTLPAKIGAWSKAINPKLFPNNTPEQVQALVASLQALVYRIEGLLDANSASQAESLARVMGEDVRVSRAGIESTFRAWSASPEAEPAAGLQERLATWLSGLEKRIGEALEQTDTGELSEQDWESFYRLLGGLRGVSEAAVAYAAVAGTIDWAQWREEVFS